jgi:hypothetical protein
MAHPMWRPRLGVGRTTTSGHHLHVRRAAAAPTDTVAAEQRWREKYRTGHPHAARGHRPRTCSCPQLYKKSTRRLPSCLAAAKEPRPRQRINPFLLVCWSIHNERSPLLSQVRCCGALTMAPAAVNTGVGCCRDTVMLHPMIWLRCLSSHSAYLTSLTLPAVPEAPTKHVDTCSWLDIGLSCTAPQRTTREPTTRQLLPRALIPDCRAAAPHSRGRRGGAGRLPPSTPGARTAMGRRPPGRRAASKCLQGPGAEAGAAAGRCSARQ